MFKILITRKAEDDIISSATWWRQNRSAEQAERWYNAIHQAIGTLASLPARCPFAEKTEKEIRNLLFGLSSNPTHRILYYIEEEYVVIFRVLHTSQDCELA